MSTYPENESVLQRFILLAITYEKDEFIIIKQMKE